MKTIKFLAVSCLLILSTVSEAQNLLTCELPRNFKKKSVFELKDNDSKVIANIHQQKKNYIIKQNNDQYLIQRRGSRQYVFVNSVLTDTIAVITNKSLLLKNIANYRIKPVKSGWKIKEGEDLEMKVKYLRSRKVYVIEILTPVYEENILNLLACYYAIRKCKEIIKSKRNYNHFVFFAGAGIY